MGDVLFSFIQMSFIINPILAIVFCFNLVEIIKKAKQGENAIDKNFLWLTISGVYIITSITWMLSAQMNMG